MLRVRRLQDKFKKDIKEAEDEFILFEKSLDQEYKKFKEQTNKNYESYLQASNFKEKELNKKLITQNNLYRAYFEQNGMVKLPPCSL